MVAILFVLADKFRGTVTAARKGQATPNFTKTSGGYLLPNINTKIPGHQKKNLKKMHFPEGGAQCAPPVANRVNKNSLTVTVKRLHLLYQTNKLQLV